MSIESTSRCRRCRRRRHRHRRRRTRLGLVRESSVLVPCRYVCKKNKFLYSLFLSVVCISKRLAVLCV